MKHLILYDGECPLCNRAIRVILADDKKKVFAFASLQGKTAKKLLQDSPLLEPPYHTLVLLQDFNTPAQKIFIEAKGSLRIAKLLGGKYALMGWLSYLPSGVFDLFYRWVAKRRYSLFSRTVKVDQKEYEGRFLD